MYATLRQYRLNPIFERDFVRDWNRLANLYQENNLIYQATLHKESKISFISYIRWRNKENYENLRGNNLPEIEKLINKIASYCNSMYMLHRMEILEELVKEK